MNEWVKYIVTPVAGASPAVRITTEVSGGPWVDESKDITIRALQPEAIPLMQAYLSGLSLDTSWTRREAGGLAGLKNGQVPDSKHKVSLNSGVEYSRTPKKWFNLLFAVPPANDDEDFTDMFEVNVLDARLAEQMFAAVVAGTLRIELA
jgi:hypothetical protein